ncbi:hypothetical protein LDH92_06770 [Bifidobacterium animalis subsp. lactis]|nr:hypothetical protein LDH92_06770 [Bifidobacterium animalis subsp. lactis]
MLANLAREALLACDKASLYCFVAGSAHEVDDLRRLGAAIPDSATCVVVQVVAGASSAVRTLPECVFITVGVLDDLPLLMEVLS